MIRPQKCYTHKTLEFSAILIVLMMLTSTLLHAQIQDFDPEFYFERSISIQKTGMIILGSWATLNIISGTAGYYLSEGDNRYFHQMNAAWNLVNLGIAAFGYTGASGASLDVTSAEMLSEMTKFDNILMINAGLDLLYIGTGAYLWRRGLKDSSDRLTGYGKSVIVQGGFLFLFDALLYLNHSPLTKDLLNLSGELTFTATGFRYSF